MKSIDFVEILPSEGLNFFKYMDVFISEIIAFPWWAGLAQTFAHKGMSLIKLIHFTYLRCPEGLGSV